ncbi:FtsJ-like methyltransferase family protein [Actinidia rufa]|uniref:FtsJ-like methyltransferase family protein n=1 Tax=Actinidia rufa TaxID=165716 RepID=A0A7J0GUJ0_9ERIC|nr:FtsJ-like methyltransferase family protein [Actinidia rufa]
MSFLIVALRFNDVLFNGNGTANGNEVDANNKGGDGDTLDGDLHPASGGGGEVEDGAGGAEEGELEVELDQLPCGARSRSPPSFLSEVRSSEVLSPACEATCPRASTSPAGSRSWPRRDPNPRPCPPLASGACPRRRGTLLPCPATLPTTVTTPAVTVCNGV